jgi:integral membrane sensor domain MASE1
VLWIRGGAWRQTAEAVAAGVVYFLVAKGSLEFASINPSASAIWPPTGLALALVMLRGQHILAGIFIGAFAANVLTAGGPVASAVIALGNTLEAFVGALFDATVGERGRLFFHPHRNS